MVNNITIKTTSKPKKIEPINNKQIDLKDRGGASMAEKNALIPEEKVEVLIKEIIRINPRDFSAFKHALEEFVNNWDK